MKTPTPRRAARVSAAIAPAAAAMVLLIAGGTPAEALVNGQATSIEQYSHVVSIRQNGNHICNGALVNTVTVATAAHCVVPIERSLSSVEVVSGTTYLDSGGQRHRVSRTYVHPNYNRYGTGRPIDDIGLIQLAQPLQENAGQRPVRLPTSAPYRGERVTVTAWGLTGDKQRVHNDLRKIDAQVMLHDECRTYLQGIMEVGSKEFCTLIGTGTGTCNGDSGAPLVRDSDRTLAGVVSGGLPCARGYPDVQTSVYPYVSWIRSIVPGV
ncbi:S1 family serine peptidase [Kitasatospora sp. NPDC051853]|uniref:S1 family serine peptidase n=1 Tax=Kitasatospora sp. NPDC051853 TaxID=3364058 RepID=UPI0037939B69